MHEGVLQIICKLFKLPPTLAEHISVDCKIQKKDYVTCYSELIMVSNMLLRVFECVRPFCRLVEATKQFCERKKGMLRRRRHLMEENKSTEEQKTEDI